MRTLRTDAVYLYTHIYSQTERSSPRRASQNMYNSEAIPLSSLNSKEQQAKEPSREANMSVGLETYLVFKAELYRF